MSLPCSTVMERSWISLKISNCQFWPLTAIALGCVSASPPAFVTECLNGGSDLTEVCVLPKVSELFSSRGMLFSCFGMKWQTWKCILAVFLMGTDSVFTCCCCKGQKMTSLRLNLSININTACSYSSFLIYLVSTLLRINQLWRYTGRKYLVEGMRHWRLKVQW